MVSFSSPAPPAPTPSAQRLLLTRRGPQGQLAGGSRLPAHVVGTDQRQRLLGSVVALVAAHGLPRTRVHAVLRRAGVSQSAFYAHYAGLGDLLLCACDAWLDQLLDRVELAVARRGVWAEGVHDGLRCLLAGVAEEPDLGRCSFLELCRLGSAGEECRRRALERLAAALRLGSNTGRPCSALPLHGHQHQAGGLSVADELLAGGVWHVVEAAILSTGARGLGSLLPDLYEHVRTCARVREIEERAA
jgi:AcrR family transcriptional regulator